MPGTTLPPSQSGTLNGPAGLIARLERLERGIKQPEPSTTKGTVALSFSYPGIVISGTPSPRWYADRSVSIGTIRISAATAGSGDCTVAVYHNGAFVLYVTVGGGENTALFAAVFTIAADDYIEVATTAASGQGDVSVQFIESA